MRKPTSIVTTLTAWPPFDQVPDDVWPMLAEHTDRLSVPAGSVLAREGELARQFVLVLDGEVATSGVEQTTLRDPGVQIGARELMWGQPYDATWTALSELDVLVVNGPAFRWAQRARRSAA
jgi:CRP-like cAMP-binding protein